MVLNRNVRPRPRPKLRQLLGQSDFTYLGYYDVVDGSTAAGLGVGLTHRYVSGTFRGIYIREASSDFPREFTLPASFGQQCTLQPAAWGDPWNGYGLTLSGYKVGIWWEEAALRLWSSWAIDYPSDPALSRLSAISTRQADSSGVVSNWHGYWGFTGVGQRAIYGGVQPVPLWFQNANSVGKYVAGFGGYTSRMAQGLYPSLGPILVFFPDPHGVYTEQAVDADIGIAADQFKIGADHRSGSNHGTDWYAGSFASRTYDRGVRASTDYVNFFDDGGLYPGTPASWQPTAKTYGDPTYDGRWTWGDTYDGTMQWIDNDAGSRLRHGIIAVGNFGSGNVWYQTSDLHYDDREYEIHVFDPARVAEVIAGTRQPYDLRPTNAWRINSYLEGVPTGGGVGSSQQARHISGATFDSVTNRLYLAAYDVPNGTNQSKMRLYVFSVGGA